jgi:hypothetical protein
MEKPDHDHEILFLFFLNLFNRLTTNLKGIKNINIFKVLDFFIILIIGKLPMIIGFLRRLYYFFLIILSFFIK